MNILVINAGSSSLKYQLIRMEDEATLCKGVCERIGIDGKYSYKTADGYKVEKEVELFTHKDAFDVILHEMTKGEGHVIDSVEEIAAVGHRVTHGGDKFSRSVLVDEAAIDAINEMRDISPLHNPPQAATIRAAAVYLAKRCRWWRYSIQRSTLPCPPRHTPLPFPTSTMRSTACAATDSTEPVTAMSAGGLRN